VSLSMCNARSLVHMMRMMWAYPSEPTQDLCHKVRSCAHVLILKSFVWTLAGGAEQQQRPGWPAAVGAAVRVPAGGRRHQRRHSHVPGRDRRCAHLRRSTLSCQPHGIASHRTLPVAGHEAIPKNAASTLCKCRPSFPISRQGATGCNSGQLNLARWDAPLSIWKGAPWSSWSTGCTNGLLKLGRLAAGLEEGTGEFMGASLPFLHRSRQGATGCKQAILKLGRLAAGLEEGTGEFMEASLALADLLYRVGHADAATQLLLGGDTVRLLQGCYVHITLPCQRHGLNGNCWSSETLMLGP
jgi:hypothetical protein